MVGRNNAGTIAQISSMIIPRQQQPTYLNLSDAVEKGLRSYDTARGWKEEDRVRGLEKNLANALETGNQDQIDKAYSQLDPAGYMDYLNKVSLVSQTADRELQDKKELMGLQNQYDVALQNIKNKGISGSGFGNTQAGLALRIAQDPTGYSDEMKQWSANYLASNSPNAVYDKAYQGVRGRKEAENEIKQAQSAESSMNENETIDEVIQTLKNKPQLVGMYAPYKTAVSRITGSRVGFSPEDLQDRGKVVRQLGSIQNSLISKAKSAGQAGINTIAEIKQTTKGVDEDSSVEEVLGALDELKRINNRMISGEAFGRGNQNTDGRDQKIKEALAQGYSMDEINKFLGVR